MTNIIDNFKTDSDIKTYYKDLHNLGLTTDNPIISEYVHILKNKGKISLKLTPPSSGSSVGKLVFERKTGWFKCQKLSLMIENDHEKYMEGFRQVEDIFKKFLVFYRNYELKLDIKEDNIFHRSFITINLDNVPGLMFYIHNLFTNDVSHWIRFKRLFAVIDGTVNPVIIDTIKFKYIKYLLQQNRIMVLNDKKDKQYIYTSNNPDILHKLMDMLIYLPYFYLFFVFKIMDINNTNILPEFNEFNESTPLT